MPTMVGRHAAGPAAVSIIVLLLICDLGPSTADLVWCNSINRQGIFGSLLPKPFKFVKAASEYDYAKSSAANSSNWCMSVIFYGTSSGNAPDPSSSYLALLGTPHDGFGPGVDNVTLDLPSLLPNPTACAAALKPALDSYATQFKTLYASEWGTSAAVTYTVQCCQNADGHGLLTDACNWLIPPLAQPGAAALLQAHLMLTLLSMLLSCIFHYSLG